MLLEYDGAEFAGWQRQAQGQRTVQGTLEAALATLSEGPVRCVGAGRTDSGVHAWGQVASGSLQTRLEPHALWCALNAVLPRDVAVRALARTGGEFHARRDAAGKHYAYHWWTGTARSPLRERTHHRVAHRLDLGAMRSAARHFEGTHDFACLQAAGSSTQTTVRSLWRVELSDPGDGTLCLQVEGDGFLRHMVRNLAGTLLEVGVGRRVPESVPALLAGRDRSRAGATAPAQGLVLVSVRYEPAIDWEAGKGGAGAVGKPGGTLP